MVLIRARPTAHTQSWLSKRTGLTGFWETLKTHYCPREEAILRKLNLSAAGVNSLPAVDLLWLHTG